MSGAHPVDDSRTRRLTEAAEWLLRMESSSRTEADVNEWLRWCAADPDNLIAFEELQRDWQDFDALKVTPVSRPARGFRKLAWAAAAAVAALAVTVAYTQWQRPPPSAVTAAVINRAATLPDGSKMILGADSAVSMDFSGATRKLDLASGEAYFKVKHDKLRPFVVHAGQISVTAVGTAFDVRRAADGQIVVTVEEGLVEVASQPAGRGAPETWRAAAGHQLRYSSRKQTALIASIDTDIALAWRGGELAYVLEPFGSVVEDLNRYSSRKIEIGDPRVAQLRFSGTAFASSLDDWLAAVEQAYPIEVQENSADRIVLRLRE